MPAPKKPRRPRKPAKPRARRPSRPKAPKLAAFTDEAIASGIDDLGRLSRRAYQRSTSPKDGPALLEDLKRR